MLLKDQAQADYLELCDQLHINAQLHVVKNTVQITLLYTECCGAYYCNHVLYKWRECMSNLGFD